MSTSARLGMTFLGERMNGAEFAVNDFMEILDTMIGLRVIDRDLATPPGSPTTGDTYIVASSGTGDWSGHDGDIAFYYSGWKFITPVAGLIAYIDDEDVLLLYDGAAWVYPNPDEHVKFNLELTTDGNTGSPSVVTITAQDRNGNALGVLFALRVRICNNGLYGTATNATIAAGVGTTSVETFTAGKDLVFLSNASGVMRINVTNATAEQNTLRIGPPPMSGYRGDYTPTINTDHSS